MGAVSAPAAGRRGAAWRIAAIVAAVLLVVAAAVGWFLHAYERVEETIDLPRTGEAARNPLYALQVALERDGVRATSQRRLDLAALAPAARDTIVLHVDPRALSTAQVDALLAWVRRGGHLVARTPAPGRLGSGGRVPLLDRLGLRALPATGIRRTCVDFRVAGEGNHVEFCRGRRFALAGARPRLRWGDAAGGHVFARVPHGAGTVDVLAGLEVLTTDQLDETTHLVLARQLLAPNYRAGAVHLVHASELPSLWRTLWREGWMAWAPLALLLLAWLWRRMQRFGPLRPAPPGERRSLLEHVGASGEHAWRYGYGHLLHAAVRDAFLARLRRRDPVAAALDGEAQAALVAARFDLTPAQVREALSTPAPRDTAGFRSRIATLIRLRNRL